MNVVPRVAAQVPGPGQYAPLTANPIGKNAKKFSIKSRVPPVTPSTRDYPGPNVYKPIHILTEPSRYSGIGFGVGNRGSPTGTMSKLLKCPYRSYHHARTWNIQTAFSFRQVHKNLSTRNK